MEIEIINNRTNLSVNLSSYVNPSGILINKFDPGKVAAKFNRNKAISQNGYTLLSTTLEDRDINIEATIIADDRTERDTFKRLIDEVLNPLDTLTIKYDNENVSREIQCSAEETPTYSTDFKNNNDFILNFNISFECFNPFWLDQKENILNVETWEGGFEFEFQLSEEGIEFARKGPNEVEINNQGNVEAPLEIYFKGPALNPSIKLNDNKFIKVDRSLQDDEILYIKTSFDDKKVQIIKNNVQEQAYHYININSTFFDLPTGINKLSYSTDGDYLPQQVIIKYKTHYYSI